MIHLGGASASGGASTQFMPVANQTETLADVLLRDGFISQGQLRTALKAQKQTAHSLGRVMVEMGFIEERLRMDVLHKTFGYDLIDLKNISLEQLATAMIPRGFAIKHKILPIRAEEGKRLVVAMEDPSDVMVLDAVKAKVGMSVRPYLASALELEEAIQTQYAQEGEEVPEEEAQETEGKSLFYRVASVTAFPVLCFVPPLLAGVLVVFYDRANSWMLNITGSGTLSYVDLAIYSALIWALWAIILFEINGLVFGTSEVEDEDEA